MRQLIVVIADLVQVQALRSSGRRTGEIAKRFDIYATALSYTPPLGSLGCRAGRCQAWARENKAGQVSGVTR